MAAHVRDASDRLATAQTKLDEAERGAEPHLADIKAAEHALRQAEHDASATRLSERFAGLSFEPPTRGGHGAELNNPRTGLSL